VQVAIVGIFLLLFIAFLDLGRAILLPVVAAVVMGAVLEPVSRRLQRFGVPRLLFATGVIGVLLAVVYLGLVLLADPIGAAVKDAPAIIAAIKSRFEELRDNVAAIRYLHGLVSDGETRLNLDFASLVKPALVFLTPALGQLVVFFATLFLFLVDQSTLRQRLILLFPTRAARLRAMHMLRDINESLIRYIGAVTIINFGVGTVTGLGLYLLQFPNPVFWGGAAFICNFIPYIGPTFIVASFLIVGLITYPTIGQALLVPGLFVCLTTIEGQAVTPNVIGHNFRTSALAAFLSLAFWAWLWGPVGAFLSLPLLIIATVVVGHLLPSKRLDLPE